LPVVPGAFHLPSERGVEAGLKAEGERKKEQKGKSKEKAEEEESWILTAHSLRLVRRRDW
jgi:hypothetical protein